MGDSSKPRILLVQIRSQHRPEQQERACFLERLAVPAGSMATWNVVQRPQIGWDDVRGFDAVILGGAGEHTVTRQYPFSEPLARVVLRWIDEGRPLFGSCWGHQFLAVILGGTVITDPDGEEVGTFDVELSAAGMADPLLRGFPRRFAAQLGHHDRVAELPVGAVELAFSEACRNQALRLVGKPVYGTQFHPELSQPRIRERLLMYRDGYLGGGGEDEVDRILGPSPEADRLLACFVERVVRGSAAPGGETAQLAAPEGVSLTPSKAR